MNVGSRMGTCQTPILTIELLHIHNWCFGDEVENSIQQHCTNGFDSGWCRVTGAFLPQAQLVL